MIHAMAMVHPGAQLDPSVHVGPYAVIDDGVSLGPESVVGPHCHITGKTSIGARNRFHSGCVIGDAPQDLKYKGEPTGLRIGDDNVFREQATVHRSNTPAEDTVIGNGCYLMVNSHLGHNAVLGNQVILANGALLSGHVVVGDRAFISGNCLVHQFVRIGTLALMQGGSRISKDLPPFTIARGGNHICGLNVIGLRRAGFTAGQRMELKRLYRLLFRSRLPLNEALSQAGDVALDSPARRLLDFAASTKRGLCTDYTLGGAESEETEE
jgi:UDP-N-acetylglucosamine acyltransferase